MRKALSLAMINVHIMSCLLYQVSCLPTVLDVMGTGVIHLLPLKR